MLIMLHDKKEINVEGIYTKHCKPTFDYTAGIIYASMGETAQAVGVAQPTVSWAIKHRAKCGGHKICTLAEMLEHADDIADELRTKQETINVQTETINTLKETIRTQEETIAQLRTIIAMYEAEQEAKRKAKEELAQRKAEHEAKRKALEEEARMLQELEESLKED